ncbi:MAG: hypothetical protein ACTHNW_13665 [Mucilaginibacter sp.]
MKKILFVAILAAGVASSVCASNLKSCVGSYSPNKINLQDKIKPVGFNNQVLGDPEKTTITTTGGNVITTRTTS